MMLQKKSNPWARLKYLYVLPLTCVTVLAFARPEVSTIERQSTQKIDASVAKATTEIGNLSANKITAFSGMDNPNGIKKKDIQLAQANNTKQAVSTTTAVLKSIIVRGKVVSTDKQPLSSIGVIGINEEGRAIVGTITNEDGTYILKVTNTTNRLQFFKSGYKTLIVPITDKLIVAMEKEPSQVDESVEIKDVSTSNVSSIILTDVVYNQKVSESNVTAMSIAVVAEVMPQYPGGDQALMKYLQESIRYPASAHKNGIEGRVICNFVVTADGDVVDVKVVKGVSPELDSEAMRVILNMPDWTPGKQDGKNINVYYTIPISFKLKRDN